MIDTKRLKGIAHKFANVQTMRIVHKHTYTHRVQGNAMQMVLMRIQQH